MATKIQKRKPNVVKGLIDAAISAYFSAIEIHNKPKIEYRYPNTTLLIINAWELALKAYVYKYIGKSKIYEKERNEQKRTITFDKAITLTCDDINKKTKNKEFIAVKESLSVLEKYRDTFAHFFEKELDTTIFMLLSKSAINFNEFILKWFDKNILENENMILLPIGFKLPFSPIEFLAKTSKNKTVNSFTTLVLEKIDLLKSEGVSDSIVVGFNVSLDYMRKVENADIIAAVDSGKEDALNLMRRIRITTDPNAQAVRVEEKDYSDYLTYDDLRLKVKERNPSLKFNKQFHSIVNDIKADKSLCEIRYLDPQGTNSLKKPFFTNAAVDTILEQYK